MNFDENVPPEQANLAMQTERYASLQTEGFWDLDTLPKRSAENDSSSDEELQNASHVRKRRSKKVLRVSNEQNNFDDTADSEHFAPKDMTMNIFSEDYRTNKDTMVYTKDLNIFADDVDDGQTSRQCDVLVRRLEEASSSDDDESGSDGDLDTSEQSTVPDAMSVYKVHSLTFDEQGVLINKLVYLPKVKWNTLVLNHVVNGVQVLYLCAVCSDSFCLIEAAKHMDLERHKRRLDECPPLAEFGENIIRRINKHQLHCAICNVTKSEMTEHIGDTFHKIQYNWAIECGKSFINNRISEYSDLESTAENVKPVSVQNTSASSSSSDITNHLSAKVTTPVNNSSVAPVSNHNTYKNTNYQTIAPPQNIHGSVRMTAPSQFTNNTFNQPAPANNPLATFFRNLEKFSNQTNNPNIIPSAQTNTLKSGIRLPAQNSYGGFSNPGILHMTQQSFNSPPGLGAPSNLSPHSATLNTGMAPTAYNAYSSNNNAYPGNNKAYSGNSNAYSSNNNAYPGNSNAYSSNSNTHSGNNNAYSSNSNAYSGNNNAFSGNNNAYPYHNNAYSSNSNAYSGNNNAYSGNNNTYSGNNNAYSGNNNAYFGNNNAFTANNSGISNWNQNANTGFNNTMNANAGNSRLNSYLGNNTATNAYLSNNTMNAYPANSAVNAYSANNSANAGNKATNAYNANRGQALASQTAHASSIIQKTNNSQNAPAQVSPLSAVNKSELNTSYFSPPNSSNAPSPISTSYNSPLSIETQSPIITPIGSPLRTATTPPPLHPAYSNDTSEDFASKNSRTAQLKAVNGTINKTTEMFSNFNLGTDLRSSSSSIHKLGTDFNNITKQNAEMTSSNSSINKFDREIKPKKEMSKAVGANTPNKKRPLSELVTSLDTVTRELSKEDEAANKTRFLSLFPSFFNDSKPETVAPKQVYQEKSIMGDFPPLPEPKLSSGQPGFSYAQMASRTDIVPKKKPKGDPKKIVVTVKNRKFLLNADNFHCIITCRAEFYCMACVRLVPSHYKTEHKAGMNHRSKLSQAPLIEEFGDNLIRNLDNKFSHCCLCNMIVPKHQIDNHSLIDFHLKYRESVIADSTFERIHNQEEYDKMISKQLETVDGYYEEPIFTVDTRPLDVDLLLNAFNLEIRVGTYAWNGLVSYEGCYRCVFCSDTLQPLMVAPHIESSEHQMKLQRYPFISQYKENLLRQLSKKWLHCGNCNILLTYDQKSINTHLAKDFHIDKVAKSTDPNSPRPTASVHTSNPSKLMDLKVSALVEMQKAKKTTPQAQNTTKATSIQAQAIKTTSAQAQAIKTTSTQAQAIKTNSTQAQAIKTSSTQAQAIKTNSTQAQAIKTTSTQAQAIKTTSTQAQAIKTTSSQAQSVKTEKNRKQSVSSIDHCRETSDALSPYLITHRRRSVVLSSNSWHGVRETRAGHYYCSLCQVSVGTDSEEHKSSLSHTTEMMASQMMDIKDFIRELTAEQVQCLTCNEVLTRTKLDLHIMEPKHISSLQAALKRANNPPSNVEVINFDEFTDETDPSTKLYLIKMKRDDDSIVVSYFCWHGLQHQGNTLRCLLCLTAVPERPEQHTSGPTHIDNLRTSYLCDKYPGNILRILKKSAYHCITCDSVLQVQQVENHLKKGNHQKILNEAKLALYLTHISAEILHFSKYVKPEEPQNFTEPKTEQNIETRRRASTPEVKIEETVKDELQEIMKEKKNKEIKPKKKKVEKEAKKKGKAKAVKAIPVRTDDKSKSVLVELPGNSKVTATCRVIVPVEGIEESLKSVEGLQEALGNATAVKNGTGVNVPGLLIEVDGNSNQNENANTSVEITFETDESVLSAPNIPRRRRNSSHNSITDTDEKIPKQSEIKQNNIDTEKENTEFAKIDKPIVKENISNSEELTTEAENATEAEIITLDNEKPIESKDITNITAEIMAESEKETDAQIILSRRLLFDKVSLVETFEAQNGLSNALMKASSVSSLNMPCDDTVAKDNVSEPVETEQAQDSSSVNLCLDFLSKDQEMILLSNVSGGPSVLVNSNSWHGMTVNVADNCIYCNLCHVNLQPSEVEKHKMAKEHRPKLKVFRLSEAYPGNIIRVLYSSLQCVTCNLVFQTQTVSKHLRRVKHIRFLTNARQKASEKNIKIAEILNYTEYTEENCYALKPDASLELKQGKLTEKQRDTFDKLAIVSETNVLKATHSRCLLCDFTLPNDDVASHFKGKTHIGRLQSVVQYTLVNPEVVDILLLS